MSVPFPNHPEPMVMRWSILEIACIKQYAADVRKDERERCAQELQRLRAHIQECAEKAYSAEEQAEDDQSANHWAREYAWHLAALQPKEPK